MMLPDHFRFGDLYTDRASQALAQLQAVAELQREVAENPVNWFSREDDRAPGWRVGMAPRPAGNGHDVLPLRPFLEVSDVNGHTFAYTVSGDVERFGEPTRRWTWRHRVDGRLTQTEVDETRASLFATGVLPLALLWMPDLATAEGYAVRVKVHPPVEVRDATERRIRWVTDVTWIVALGVSGKAPATAKMHQGCATCRWWAPLCAHPGREGQEFKARLQERVSQQQQGLEALPCLGWEPEREGGAVTVDGLSSHSATAPSSVLVGPTCPQVPGGDASSEEVSDG